EERYYAFHRRQSLLPSVYSGFSRSSIFLRRKVANRRANFFAFRQTNSGTIQLACPARVNEQISCELTEPMLWAGSVQRIGRRSCGLRPVPQRRRRELHQGDSGSGNHLRLIVPPMPPPNAGRGPPEELDRRLRQRTRPPCGATHG